MKHLIFVLAIASGACVTEPDKPLPPEQQPGDGNGSDDGLETAEPELLDEPPLTTPEPTPCHLRSKNQQCLP